MGNIHLNINNNVEQRFRIMANKKFGMKKGCLSKAVEEALEMWLANNEAKI